MYLNLRKIKKLQRNGFTLVEIMVAMVLASLLAIGMQSFLAMLGEEIQDFTLRQKAIFILNGEMEKFNYMGRSAWLNSAESVNVSFSDYTGTIPPHMEFTSAAHKILRAGFYNDFVTDSGATFNQADANNQPVNEHLIYYYAPSGGPNRNVVWLDFEKKITARLSFVILPFDTASCYQGAIGRGCFLLTVYLDYPYRFTEPPTGNPLSTMDGKRVNTLVLRTITGQWKQP